MSKGGSGGSSSTQQFTPPEWTTSYGDQGVNPWADYLYGARDLATTPYQQYGGQKVADINPDQQLGFDLTRQVAMNGSPDTNAARGQLTTTANGGFLNTNPYFAPNSTLGQTMSGAALQSNPYTSPAYSQAVINDNVNAMTAGHQRGAAAQLDAAAARAGAYGGSAYQSQQAANQVALDNSIGTMANQYQLQNQQLASQSYQQERDRQQAASLAGAGAYGQERTNMMNASQLGLGGQQLDLSAAQALTGVGDSGRAYTQDLLNQGVNDWQQQQLYPAQMLDIWGNALARSSGNVAGGSAQTTTSNYQASPYAQLLGGAGAVYAGSKLI